MKDDNSNKPTENKTNYGNKEIEENDHEARDTFYSPQRPKTCQLPYNKTHVNFNTIL